MISEGSRETEDCNNNDTVIISQYYCFYCIK